MPGWACEAPHVNDFLSGEKCNMEQVPASHLCLLRRSGPGFVFKEPVSQELQGGALALSTEHLVPSFFLRDSNFVKPTPPGTGVGGRKCGWGISMELSWW